MKRTTYYFAIASILVLAVSCKKDIPDLENTYPGSTASNGALSTYLQQAGPQQQTFSFNAANGTYIEGTSGTKLNIAPNSFVYPNQQPVTGMVDIHLIEVLDKKAMVCTGGFTTANGVPIQSGGEIYITAWQGANQVQLSNTQGGIYAQIPAGLNTPAPMQQFFAAAISDGQDFDRVDTSQLQITWDTSAVTYSQYYYNINVYDLGWVNCDMYMAGNDLTEFSCSLPQPFNHENTMLLISFTDYNTVAKLYAFDEEANAYVSGYYQLPVGFDVKFMTLSEINGQFYYSEQSATISEDLVTSMTPQPCTQAFIDQKLNEL